MSYDEESKENNAIKCAFCDWKTTRWTTNKNGKRKNGMAKLLNHVEFRHFNEYIKIKEINNGRHETDV